MVVMASKNNGHLYNEAAEQSVLAALISGNLSVEDCLAVLSRDSFYHAKHKEFFDACVKIHESGSQPDMVLVSQHVNSQDMTYLSSIMEYTISRMNVQPHIEALRDLHIRREIQKKCESLHHSAADLDSEAKTIIDQAQSSLMALTADGNTEALPLAHILTPVFDAIDSGDNTGMGFGLPTGFPSLDNIMSGLHPGNLIILAARPRMGKSAFAGQLQVNLAISSYPTAFFSLEMDRSQIVYRLLANVARVDFQAIRNGSLDDEKLHQLYNAAGTLHDLPIYIDDSPGLPIYELKARARKLVQRHGVKAIFIDYLHKIRPSKKSDTRDQEVFHVAEELKNLAKELHIPIICLSQLNRKCDERSNSRPVLSDLRESGGIEQEADDIIFLYRDAVYKKTQDRTAEITVAKQRNGPEGTAKLIWMGEYLSFEEMAYEQA